MNIEHLAIDNIDQVNVGDKVVVVDTNYTQTTRILSAEVTRVLKTKFELTYKDGNTAEFSTDIDAGCIRPKGMSRGEFGASTTRMFPRTEEVAAWCKQEVRKAKAKELKTELFKFVGNSSFDGISADEMLGVAREIAHKANLLVELAEEISATEHEATSRGE